MKKLELLLNSSAMTRDGTSLQQAQYWDHVHTLMLEDDSDAGVSSYKAKHLLKHQRSVFLTLLAQTLRAPDEHYAKYAVSILHQLTRRTDTEAHMEEILESLLRKDIITKIDLQERWERFSTAYRLHEHPKMQQFLNHIYKNGTSVSESTRIKLWELPDVQALLCEMALSQTLTLRGIQENILSMVLTSPYWPHHGIEWNIHEALHYNAFQETDTIKNGLDRINANMKGFTLLACIGTLCFKILPLDTTMDQTITNQVDLALQHTQEIEPSIQYYAALLLHDTLMRPCPGPQTSAYGRRMLSVKKQWQHQNPMLWSTVESLYPILKELTDFDIQNDAHKKTHWKTLMSLKQYIPTTPVLTEINPQLFESSMSEGCHA